MFASQLHRRDFADTRTLSPESMLNFPGAGAFDDCDAAEQMEQADAADSQLLRLVASVAGATLVLALVTSLTGV